MSSNSVEAYAWVPFAAAAVMVLLGPWVNSLWGLGYDAYYRENYATPIPTHGQLRAGAEWAVDVAQAVPNTTLTLIGVLLLQLSEGVLVAVVCLVVLVLVVTVAVVVVRKHDLTERRSRFRFLYSPLAITLLLLNGGGLVLAFSI